MAKKTGKKKVVIPKKKATSINTTAPRATRASSIAREPEPMLFGRLNYILMIVGVVLMGLGFILMLGGHMPSPDVWDEDIIYGFRRTVLAPFMMVAGLVTLVFSIFKKDTQSNKQL